MRLSAIVCNYNHGAYIAEALRSILEQTRPPDEILVIDDGSTDDSLQVLRPIAAREARVQLIELPHNVGVQQAANLGLERASGNLVAFPAADDTLMPTFYEKALALLEAHPGAALAVGCIRNRYPDRCEVPSFQEATLRVVPRSAYLPPEQVVRMEKAYIPLGLMGYASVFRLTYLREVLPFPSEAGHLVDWLYMRALAFRHGYCLVAEVMVDCRVLEGSISGTAGRSRDKQRRAFRGVLETLLSPAYSDCLPSFVESASLAVGGYRMVAYIIAHPRYWRFLTPPLLAKGLIHWLTTLMPPQVNQLLRKLQSAFFRWRQGGSQEGQA